MLIVVTGTVGIMVEGYSYVTLNLFYTLFAIELFTCIVEVRIKNGQSGEGVLHILRRMSSVIYYCHMYVFVITTHFIWGQKEYGFKPFIICTVVSIFIAFFYSAFIYPIIKSRKKKLNQK